MRNAGFRNGPDITPTYGMAAVSVAPPASRAEITLAVGRSRRRCSLLADPAGSVGELASALGLGRRAPVWIDGHRHEPSERLASTGIVMGSDVDVEWPAAVRRRRADRGTAAPDRSRDERAPSGVVVVVRCVAGPASGSRWALVPGSYVLGRGAASTLVVPDPAIEPHAILFDVDPAGTVTVLPLAGRLPVFVGPTPLYHTAVLDPDVPLFVGASRIEVSAADTEIIDDEVAIRRPGLGAEPGLGPIGPWARAWRRVHRTPSSRAPVGIGSERIDEQRRAFVDHHRQRVPTVDVAVETIMRRRASLWSRRPGHGDAFTVTLGHGALDWEPPGIKRTWRSGWRDATETLPDEAVPIDLGPGASVALVGDGDGDAIARSLIVQLAANTGPADWSLVIVTDDPHRWAWSRWLPHLEEPGGDAPDAHAPPGRRDDPVVLGARSNDVDAFPSCSDRWQRRDDRHLVVVTDRADLLSPPRGVLREVLDARPSAALVAVAPSAPPPSCRTVVTAGVRWRGSWTADTGTARARPIHLSGLTLATARDAARQLAPLVDQDLVEVSDGADLPHVDHVSLAELIAEGPAASDPRSMRARWQLNDHGRALATPIGITHDGAVDVDLVADGPHGVVVEGGDSAEARACEVLRTMVVGLAARYPPHRLNLVLADDGDRTTFDAAVVLPHVVEHLDRSDDDRVRRLLAVVETEIGQRRERLAAAGVGDLASYDALRCRDGRPMPPIPRLVIAVDTTNDRADADGGGEDRDAVVPRLRDLVGSGGELGVHLLLAVRAGAGSTGLHDVPICTPAFTIVVDGRGPRPLQPPRPGEAGGAHTAMVDRAGSGPTPCWLARCNRPDTKGRRAPVEPVGTTNGDSPGDAPLEDAPSEIDVFVRTICRLSDVSGAGPARPLWLAPLPDALPPEGFDGSPVPAGAVGLADIPEERRRVPLRWRVENGSVALIGSRGSGTSSTVLRLLDALGAMDPTGSSAGSRRCWIVDGDPDGRVATGRSPVDGRRVVHAGGDVVVSDAGSVADAARVIRAFRRELRRRHDRPGATAPEQHPVLLVVDGVDHRWARPFPGTSARSDRWCDVLATLARDGPAVGITVVAAGPPTPEMLTVAGGCGVRWLFNADPADDLAVLGRAGRDAPTQCPGRCLDLATDRFAQIVVPASRAAPPGRNAP